MSRRTIVILAMVWIVILVAGSTATLTIMITGIKENTEPTKAIHAVSEEEYATLERYKRLDEVRVRLLNEYYVSVDENTLINGAVDGMMASLDDPYTFYYTPEEMKATQESNSGIYNGVGMLVTGDKNGMLEVIRVFKGSPALESGMLPGDKIVAVNGTQISAATTAEMNAAVELIKGETGTSVTLSIFRKGKSFDLYLTRRSVVVNRVEYQILQDNIGYIILYEFYGDAVEGVKEALDAFESANVKGVIFDIRSNPGGLLTDVVKICDMLLPEGLIVYMEDRDGNRDSYYSDADCYSFPLVVLVNENSASASEILAASVQDYGVGTIVGTVTYGKGIVQTQYEFYTDGAGMQLTTSAYYTPSGRSIHKQGVTPDVIVEMDDQYDAGILEIDMDNDNQLESAYQVLQKKIAESK